MKKLCLIILCLFSMLMPVEAKQFVNITPMPKKMVVGEGTYRLPKSYTVDVAFLADSLQSEATRFVDVIRKTTGCKGKLVKSQKANISMQLDKTIAYEGYRLNVGERGIRVSASSARGFFYAFQTLKKMMPANVMAGMSVDEAQKAVPHFRAEACPEIAYVDIDDEPRFWYRGFMLDCGRHFFTVDEIKHILDGMAIYKYNYFHWHLTEDQGWRFEVKKYPRLTEVGSVASDCRMTDMEKGHYWLGKPYGPYFYTQEDCREIVEY
ncbi:MAG: family 20 glycosylhydrolase, partial [Bacteroidaceae bacterium]|nr:family 20 glycosylhydrolase [Bacteroidaceae bacterium]